MVRVEGRRVVVLDGRWSRYCLPHSNHSEHNAVSSTHNDADVLHSDVLRVIAKAAQDKKRLPPKEAERIILELCRGCWLRSNELAQLMARKSGGLRERFLNPVVARGMLRLRYPNTPNHSGQAYTAVIPEEGVA